MGSDPRPHNTGANNGDLFDGGHQIASRMVAIP